MIAFIPARGGSKRIPMKNLKPLGGLPLIAWTFRASIDAERFERVVIATDSPRIADVAQNYAMDVYMREPSSDIERDIEWLEPALAWAQDPDQFCLLRPTGPFRSAACIRRAFELFGTTPDCDSMRAMRPVSEHPGKMWEEDMAPYVRPHWDLGADPCNYPTQSLPQVWVQTAGLEMAHTSRTIKRGSLSGDKVAPFFTKGWEGIDINEPADLLFAEMLVEKGLVQCP